MFFTDNKYLQIDLEPTNNILENAFKKKLLNIFSNFFFIWKFNPSG